MKKITDNSPIEIAFNAVGDPDSRAACLNSLAQGGKLVDVISQTKDEADGRKVFTIHGSPHPVQNREFGRILWKHLPRLVQEGRSL